MNGYITAADVAHLRGITLNHVYVLACTHKWRRIRTGDGRVRYHLEDVTDTLTRPDETTTQQIP